MRQHGRYAVDQQQNARRAAAKRKEENPRGVAFGGSLRASLHRGLTCDRQPVTRPRGWAFKYLGPIGLGPLGPAVVMAAKSASVGAVGGRGGIGGLAPAEGCGRSPCIPRVCTRTCQGGSGWFAVRRGAAYRQSLHSRYCRRRRLERRQAVAGTGSGLCFPIACPGGIGGRGRVHGPPMVGL